MSEDVLLQEVRAIRKLLELLAEPAIAQRDGKLRAELMKIAGVSTKKQKAALLMDGSHTQGEISKEVGIDKSDLSKMVAKLDGAGLLIGSKKHPKLAIQVPASIFDV